MEPDDLSYQFLREITDDFSDEQKLGEGAFGVVYKGVTKNGEDIAVKKLHNTNLDYKQFQNEFYNLRKLKHRNIVQVLGYCYEIEEKPFIMHDGSKVLVDETYRALCFEYLHNGSLQKHLSDELCGLDWHTRFKIIQGTCDGLKYIHEELEEPMYHLDLKPDNILLDKDMVPKIADFGLSRIFGKELTRTTQNPYGTHGYQPPEYIDKGEISGKFDIFSLGVIIIRIVSGLEGYPKCLDMSSNDFIDQVHKNWRDRFKATCSDSLSEAYCHQVEICTQIALDCVEKDSQKRPDIVKITKKLNELQPDTIKFSQKGWSKTVARMMSHIKNRGMRKKAKDIIGQYQDLNLIVGPGCSDPEYVDAQETSYVVEEHIVGRTEEKGKILNFLIEGMSKKVTILPIYGIGGIGKTTFARLIYTDPEFSFYSQIWVYVSRILDLNKIRDSIILQLSKKKSPGNERKMMYSCLTTLLSGKKILIVLDDLWEDDPFQLQELKEMLYHDDSNVIVLVTTRSERVAERICINSKPYKISPLTNDMCWDIIKQRSGFEARDDKEQLGGIGWEIAQKCGGVALAAQSIGFTLRSLSFDQWMKVKSSDIWNEPTSNHVLASLKLSYTYMDPCLKPCFTYCAIFPKGHNIVKNDLIYQWISLDFIKPTKILSNMQLCEKYILQLLGLSFFQHSASPKIAGAYEKDFMLFTMHDLVHDLAKQTMGDGIRDSSKQAITGGLSCRYSLFTDCSKALKSSTSNPEEIRALMFMDCFKIELHSSAFSSAKSLRVLDLSECRIYELPACIGTLVQLRYLDAQNIQSKMTPDCISKLSELVYLNLSGSEMLALPESMGEIKGLMYLDISNCPQIRQLPSSFTNLKKLVHLDLSKCCSLIMVSYGLDGLTNLEYLNLSHPGSQRYEYPPFLDMCDRIGNLIELRYLGLSNAVHYTTLFNEKINLFIGLIWTLTNLEHLDLSHNFIVVSVSENIGNLRKLHTLDLSFCINLMSLPECMTNMDSLKILNVTGCLKLDNSTLPRSNTVIVLPHFVVRTHDGESSSDIGNKLRHVNPEVLHISSLDNVKSAEEAKSIKLIGKQGIKELTLEWARGAQRFVEDMQLLQELVPPRTLRKFSMKGYNSSRFPPWVMDITFYLPDLIKIELCDLRECNSIPPLGQLPNLEELVIAGMDSITTINEDFGGNARTFPRLKRFRLCDCPKLRLKTCPPRAEIWEIENSDQVLSSSFLYENLLSYSLDSSSLNSRRTVRNMTLTVISSKVPLHEWKVLLYVPAITELRIIRCADLTCRSPEIIRSLSLIRSLWLEENAQREFPEWFGGLISLRELIIRRCTEMRNLEQSMWHLTSLQLLSLNGCPSITMLAESLPFLAHLVICDCRGIKSLPKSILTKLRLLYIYYCPELEEWCEDNMMQLARITDKIMLSSRMQGCVFSHLQEHRSSQLPKA